MKEEFRLVALSFVLIISTIFVVQQISAEISQSLALKSDRIISEPWTLATYIFLHGSFSHLYSNMFALALFGTILERIIGYRNFLKVFFFTGAFSGLASTFFYSSIIGASGSVFGIMGVLAMLRPRMVVWALGVPMYMIVAIIVYALLDLAGIFYPSNIAHAGHLSALALGISIGLMWRKKYEISEVGKRPASILSEEELRSWEEKYMK